jgi:hypothetical protein
MILRAWLISEGLNRARTAAKAARRFAVEAP